MGICIRVMKVLLHRQERSQRSRIALSLAKKIRRPTSPLEAMTMITKSNNSNGFIKRKIQNRVKIRHEQISPNRISLAKCRVKTVRIILRVIACTKAKTLISTSKTTSIRKAQ